MPSKGFLHIATGDKYIEEAKITAKNTKRRTDLPVAVVSDREIDSEYIDDVIIDESPDRSFFDKPKNLLKTPYDKTIYMDDDVFLFKPVPELFEMLDTVDIATAIDPNEFELRYLNHQKSKMEGIPESVPLYQTGVIAYKLTSDVENLIRNWIETHKTEQIDRDQTSFRMAIYNTDVDHITISNLYNCLAEWPMQVTGDVKIIHGHLDVEGPREIERMEQRMNATDDPRLFYTPNQGKIYAPIHPYINQVVRHLSTLATRVHRMYQFLGWG